MPDTPPILSSTYPDFSPGIVSNIRQVSSSSPSTPGYFFAPMGTAAEGTFRCVANDYGDLVPAPTYDTSRSFTRTLSGLNGVNDLYRYVGLNTMGPIVPSAASYANVNLSDAVYVAIEYNVQTAGPTFTRTMSSFVHKPYTSPATNYDLPARTGAGAGTAIGLTSCHVMTFANTRAGVTPYTQPGHPVTFAEWAESIFFEKASGPNNYIWTMPDPASPGTDSVAALTIPSAGPAQIVAHQGRVLFLQSPATEGVADNFAGGVNLTNEYIAYTDPPNSIVMTTPIVLDPQFPGGYGAWGSITFGELLLVKRSHGALLIDGDIYAPTVTRLPGVQSTGGIRGAATPCIAGLMYVAEDGAYLWEGGSTSRKVSKINDRFFARFDTSGNAITGSDGVTVQHCSWGQYVVFPNNWMYDCINDSWWQLEDPSVFNIALPAASMSNTALFYAVQDAVTGSSGNVTVAVKCFTRFQYASSYKWVGQPFPPSVNRRIDIREVTITLANIPATGAVVTVNFVGDNATTPATGQTIQFAIPPGSPYPVTLHQKCAFQGDYISPIITVAAGTVGSPDLTSPAPTIPKGGLTIGWSEAEPFAAEVSPE